MHYILGSVLLVVGIIALIIGLGIIAAGFIILVN